jgi:predicted transposase/invertase (TIGR01784 family)
MDYIITKDGKLIVSPRSDIGFKHIFANEQHKSILVSFLRAILDLPDEDYDVTIVDPHLQKEQKDDKLAIVDVRLATPTGKTINIEIQVLGEDGFKERLCFGMGRLVTKQLKEGDAYADIKKVICIAITGFNVFADDQCHHRFLLTDIATGLHFGDIVEINTLELPKVQYAPEGELKNWAAYFGARTEEELMEVASRDVHVNEAVQNLWWFSEEGQKWQQEDYDIRTRMMNRGVLAYYKEAAEEAEAKLAAQAAELATKDNELAAKDNALAAKDAQYEAQLAALRAQVATGRGVPEPRRNLRTLWRTLWK